MSQYPQNPYGQNPYGRQPQNNPYGQYPQGGYPAAAYQTQMPGGPAHGLQYSSARDEVGDSAIFNFFNQVYAWMAVGLGVTAVVGYLMASTKAIFAIGMPGIVVLALASFALSWYVQSQIGKLSAGTALSLFLVYAAMVGAMISGIFLVYSSSTLLAAFVLTAGVFGAMSIYGFVTKRNLAGIGGIAIMLAFGLFLASIVNLFLANGPLSWLITYGVLIVFVIITAYETQMLKGMAEELRYNPQMLSRVAAVGSLMLYISFINLFISILRILGDRE